MSAIVPICDHGNTSECAQCAYAHIADLQAQVEQRDRQLAAVVGVLKEWSLCDMHGGAQPFRQGIAHGVRCIAAQRVLADIPAAAQEIAAKLERAELKATTFQRWFEVAVKQHNQDVERAEKLAEKLSALLDGHEGPHEFDLDLPASRCAPCGRLADEARAALREEGKWCFPICRG